MSKIIAIVGRPNVGKSTLFNRLARKQKAIIDDIPGVTRDRNYADIKWDDTSFTLVDTGGIEVDSKDHLSQHVRKQAHLAMDEADVILFLTDGLEGLTPVDTDLISLLRTIPKPIFYCINKIDGARKEEAITDFYQSGVDAWYPLSSKHGRGVSDLMEAVITSLPRGESKVPTEEAVIKIAVLGRPNVGKSSLVNRILGYERVIVSESPGTTRDAVDTPFEYKGRKYCIIDTAGIRRKSRIGYQLEKYCVLEALRALRRCDVALIIIDAEEGVAEQDAKIAGQALSSGKACILVINKWDLIEKDNATVGRYVVKLRENMKFLDFAPIVFVSALSGQRVSRLLDEASACFKESQKRIGTGELNRFLREVVNENPPARHQGRLVKLYYLTQVDSKPPTFIFFTNYPKAIHFSYERYLENRLREEFGFEGSPLRLFFRRRTRESR